MQLHGRLVLVTGASSGIGRATALELARRGARVVLVARTASKLEDTATAIGEMGGTAHAESIDLSDPAAVATGMARIVEAHGVPDAVVNNAGAGTWRSVEETELDEVVSQMGAPYFAAFFTTRCLIEPMVARGSGRILNVNSPACLMPFPGAVGYSASRAALRTFSDALALELKGTGVGVTHLIAGEVSSEYFDHNPGSHERIPTIARFFPVMTPEQVATVICDALVSERAQVVVPFLMWATWLSYELAPWLVRRLVQSTAWRPRRS